MKIIFTLLCTSHIQDIILKFICNNILNTKNNTEYLSIVPEFINFSPNKVNATISAKTNNNILNAIQIIKKFLVKSCFTSFIFLCSHFACISENTGKRSQKIGVIIKKGILIILK
ncbi:hypothetical protein HOF65_03615 [bacterium]|jgi:hypothetical protein|nr:hypothetical protein [bacterium]MBT3853068.1 hypothetical protein [bacterium]